MVTSVVMIADDLTGAADSAAAFARQGLRTMVLWEGRSLPGADVLVFTTESRHRTADEAVRRVDEVVGRVAAMPGAKGRTWLYKKVDSTLRGHPGPELAAVMAGIAVKRALVAPAFPAQGRVTRAGVQIVQGIPLAESPFGREVPTSDVGERFARGFTEGAVHRLSLPAIREGADAVAAALATVNDGIVVADAETEADLDCLAVGAMLSDTHLLCGSAGLAGALMRALAAHGQGTPQSDPPPVSRWWGEHILVVAASRHPQTLRQVEVAEAAGIPVIRPGMAWFQEEAPSTPTLPRRRRETEHEVLLDRCARQLALGPVMITSQGLPDLPGQNEKIAARLAQLVRELLSETLLAGLVLTGGDAAMAVGRALEAEALWLQGEVQPGIPWGYWVGGAASGMPVVTKAGGFGDDGALLAVISDKERRPRHEDSGTYAAVGEPSGAPESGDYPGPGL